MTAVNSVGESLASESVEVTPAATPDPPRSVIAVATDGGANLEWSPPATDGGDPIANYRVRVWHEATAVVEFDTVATNASISGLINGVDYRATVTALNSVGESIASEPAFLRPVAPPVVEPPTTHRRPSSPVNISVISATRKLVTVGWAVHDSGGAPVLDYVVHTSRYKNKGFTISPDATSATPRAELRKPRRGALYVRVIAVTSAGESVPSPAKRVVR
jgi:hypothetical protein